MTDMIDTTRNGRGKFFRQLNTGARKAVRLHQIAYGG
jgi:hypothetical protein